MDPKNLAKKTITVELPASAFVVRENPRLASQRNSLAILGIPPAAFLEKLRAFESDGHEVIRSGKLRLVEVDAFVRWLSRRSTARALPEPENDVEALERELGLVAVGGTGR